MVFFVLFAPIICGVLALAQRPEPIPCNLEWKPASDLLSDKTVFAHDGENVIVRTKINGEYIAGTYSLTSDLAFFATGSTTPNATVFEVLTNPHECIVTWTKESNGNVGKYPVPVEKGKTDKFIGKVSIQDYANLWYAGEISQASGGLKLAVDQDDVRTFGTYDSLTSYSGGLTLELTDFEFNTDPFSNKNDFLGVDEIHNESPATVNQTVTHMKRITEIYSITTNKTWKSVRTEVTKTKILFVTITKTKTTTWEEAQSETITTTESREVSVSRLVSVPPFTSIQACSTISIKENVDLEYSALGKYTAKGLTNKEILDILHAEGIKQAQIIGEEVVVKGLTGGFSAAIAMNTEFYVSPFGSGQECGGKI